MSNHFAFGLFDLEWDVFSTHIEGAVNRIPVIGETGVKSTVCGPGTINKNAVLCVGNVKIHN